MLDCVKDSIDSGSWCEPWLCSFSEDASADKYGVPLVFTTGRLVVLVGATNIRLRGITNEVYGLWGLVHAVGILPPLLQQSCGEFEGAELRFAKRSRYERPACNALIHGFRG